MGTRSPGQALLSCFAPLEEQWCLAGAHSTPGISDSLNVAPDFLKRISVITIENRCKTNFKYKGVP